MMIAVINGLVLGACVIAVWTLAGLIAAGIVGPVLAARARALEIHNRKPGPAHVSRDRTAAESPSCGFAAMKTS
jgi:hypothetical protein